MSIDFAFSAMAARSDDSPALWRRPFLKWLDGIEAGWAIPLLLAAFVAIWMAFLSIAYLNGDLHPDALETWTLGRSFEWGYQKHPPLMGWVARAWTTVFPLADWSFRLLAMTNSAFALWTVDLISRRFVRGDGRVVVLLLLMLLPTYQFHAQRFNANTVLLTIWPLATYCFLRSFETRHLTWAIAAGITAAIAMLGKYYSIFLICSFPLAAILHSERRIYLGSLAPWVSATTGLAVLGPHLYWLATTGATPFEYALAAHTGRTFLESLEEAVSFLSGCAAAMAIAALAWIMIAGDRLKQVLADFRAMNSELWLLFLVSLGTIALPVITALMLGTDLPPLWAYQGLFLFGILIVCGASYPIQRFYSVNLAVLVIGIALVAVVIAAPIHAIYRNDHAFEEGRNFYRLAATELTRRWHEQSSEPLPAVSGDDALAFATAFYSPDHPVYATSFAHDHVSGATRQMTLEHGGAALCFEGQEVCGEWIGHTALTASQFVRTDFVVRSTLLGWLGARRRVTAFIVPPRKSEMISQSSGSIDAERSGTIRLTRATSY
jgi:4-amino-4-deoxy-L-arabinose transferase-like glycosyltransferase